MSSDRGATFRYPPARHAGAVDAYHGTPVPDPYRWLEEPDTDETRAWIAAEVALSRGFLDGVPQRPAIRQRLTTLWNYPRTQPPWRRGAWYYFYRNDGLQDQAVLFRSRSPAADGEAVLDPNTLAPGGTAAITSLAITDNGSHLAYGVSLGGSDRQELRIRHVDAGVDYQEVLHHCRFVGIAWTTSAGEPDGFYYNRDPRPDPQRPEAPPLHNRLYWHRLGTQQADDVLIYERPDRPELNFPPEITSDGRFLVLTVWHAAVPRNRLYYRRTENQLDFVRLVDEPDAYYTFVGNVGRTFFVQTDWAAPRGRLMAVDLRRPQRQHWREIVPETDDILTSTCLVGKTLVVVAMRQANHQIRLYDLDGAAAGSVLLPGPGTVSALRGRQVDRSFFFQFESYLDPGTVYRVDLSPDGPAAAAPPPEPVAAPPVTFDRRRYETRQVHFASRDGTPISMSLTHARDLPRDGHSPVLLYGYGGFGISHTPGFAPHAIYWLEQGGIFADVNLRGGGEYGESWHQAGMLERKQNVFDDFIAAAEWLVSAGLTRPQSLGIIGRSNGGLLVTAVMLQRPDLFAAVVAVVPVTDMLRYQHFTAGRHWTAEYGDAGADPAHFEVLLAYSPLHNVRPGVVYPPVLITTALGDDRVVPMHAMKFAAALQAAADPASPHPILIRIDTDAGHGLGKPTGKWIDEFADIHAFLQATILDPFDE